MGVRIPGYEIGAAIGRGAGSVVYRAEREGMSYAVKVLQSDDVEAGLRFRQEAAALARLNHPGLIKVIETGEAEGSSFMVMELVEGQTLSAQLEKGPISEAQTIALAKGLAGAIGEVHRHGLVHRDLKPSNIVVSHNGRATIIDFGFVGRAQAEDDAPEDQVVGTFLYAPPEQTGMLRRPVDGRSDLYALGCVLYECLTGRPPFEADSVAELLKRHAAVRPKPVREKSPRSGHVMAAIVEKLLTKDPDNRYQSARGLLADLEDLSALDSARAAGEDVVFGAKDSQLPYSAEIPMVGREEELSRLEAAWERARAGHGSIMQIEGEPGMGKTRLARELLAIAEEQGALVLMGKAQKSERVPYGALREAIDGYFSRVRRLPATQQESHGDKARRAAGDMAGVVRRLTPGLTRFFADSRDVPPLEPAEEEQRRFNERVADFAVDLAREHGAALLLVDDVQWADEGTVEIVRHIAELLHSAPLLVVTTARNDPESDSAREAFVEKVGEEHLQISALGQLDSSDVRARRGADSCARGATRRGLHQDRAPR